MEIEEETESGRDWRSIGDRLQTALRGGYLRCAQTRGTDFHHEIRPSSCFAPAIFLLRPCLSWPTSSSLPPFRWVAFPKQGNNSLRRGAKLCSGHAVSVPRAKLCSGPSICMLRVARSYAFGAPEDSSAPAAVILPFVALFFPFCRLSSSGFDVGCSWLIWTEFARR